MIKNITLHKAKEIFIIKYEPGTENQVLNQIIEWVNESRLNFDWFDAAILSHELGQQISQAKK